MMSDEYKQDFSKTVIESGSGGAGGRGGDVGSHNINTTNNTGDTIVAKGTKAYNYILSGLKGNGNTGNVIINNAGNTINNSSTNNSVDNSRTNNSNDNSVANYFGRDDNTAQVTKEKGNKKQRTKRDAQSNSSIDKDKNGPQGEDRPIMSNLDSQASGFINKAYDNPQSGYASNSLKLNSASQVKTSDGDPTEESLGKEGQSRSRSKSSNDKVQQNGKGGATGDRTESFKHDSPTVGSTPKRNPPPQSNVPIGNSRNTSFGREDHDIPKIATGRAPKSDKLEGRLKSSKNNSANTNNAPGKVDDGPMNNTGYNSNLSKVDSHTNKAINQNADFMCLWDELSQLSDLEKESALKSTSDQSGNESSDSEVDDDKSDGGTESQLQSGQTNFPSGQASGDPDDECSEPDYNSDSEDPLQAAQRGSGSPLNSGEPGDDSENESCEDIFDNSDGEGGEELQTAQLGWTSGFSPSSELSEHTYYESDGPLSMTGYIISSPKIASMQHPDPQVEFISRFDDLIHHLVPNSQRVVNIGGLFPEFSREFHANIENETEKTLIDMVHSLNESIASISLDIASVVPPHLLKKRRLEFHMTEYQNERQTKRCVGTSGVQLAIQSKLNALLFESIFLPFSPGLDTEMSNGLLGIYSRLKDSNFDHLDNLALWKSMTYSHCRTGFDGLALSETIAEDFLCAIENLIPTWVPSAASVMLPNIVSTFKSVLTDTIIEALELQDLSQTITHSGLYAISMPKGGTRFDSFASDRRFCLSKSSTGNIANHTVVVGSSSFGLSKISKGPVEGHMIKSEVIVTDSMAIYYRIVTNDICVY